MQATLQALLSGVIDYAGMFPPASLPLEQAIQNYLRYRTEPESWMLGRFICPAARLRELTPHLAGLDPSAPLVISALGKGGMTLEEFEVNVKADRQAIQAFRERHRGLAVVDVFEVRLPGELPAQKTAMQAAVKAAHTIPDVRCFFEAGYPPGSPELRELLGVMELGALLRILETLPPFPGFKYRCGGADPAAYPSTKDLAGVIETGCALGQPLKFTAGLHHPIRHYNAAAGAHMHGFINVFVGALLHSAHRVPAEPILADEDAGDFVFTDTAIRWKNHELSAEAVRLIRQFREKVISFGSCSFDEPRDDLRKLGWLP
jgi:hypothetical protein